MHEGSAIRLPGQSAFRSWLSALWRGLREWSGDDAYERYLAAHAGHGHAVLSRRAFYHAYFIDRASRPRCC